MASLKEIRARLASVNSTKKITGAMRMVSAAKLHKSEDMTLKFVPYKNKLTDILTQYLGSLEPNTLSIPLAQEREVKRVAIVCISSNTGLCGSFNSTINKLVDQTVADYKKKGVEIIFYPIGKKVSDYVKKLGYPYFPADPTLVEKPDYEQTSAYIKPLVEDFLTGKVDRIVLLYNHHKNAAVQILTNEVLLPISTHVEDASQTQNYLYFTEPDVETVINQLVPNVIRMRFYAAVLDSHTAEQGARTTAMQIAADNANKMIEQLTQQYNRARQEVITNELLDIVGGSEALRNS